MIYRCNLAHLLTVYLNFHHNSKKISECLRAKISIIRSSQLFILKCLVANARSSKLQINEDNFSRPGEGSNLLVLFILHIF